jgi:hypothetical protein
VSWRESAGFADRRQPPNKAGAFERECSIDG